MSVGGAPISFDLCFDFLLVFFCCSSFPFPNELSVVLFLVFVFGLVWIILLLLFCRGHEALCSMEVTHEFPRCFSRFPYGFPLHSSNISTLYASSSSFLYSSWSMSPSHHPMNVRRPYCQHVVAYFGAGLAFASYQ